MIASVLKHLEELHLELMTIDPSHRTDAADKVADIASGLRKVLIEAKAIVPDALAEEHPAAEALVA